MKFFIAQDSLNVLDMDSFRNEIENLKEHCEVVYPYVKEAIEREVFLHRYEEKFRVKLPDKKHVRVLFSLSNDQQYLKTLLAFSKPVEFILENPNLDYQIEQYDHEWHLVMMEIKTNLEHYYDIGFYTEVVPPDDERGGVEI
jgi:hypothetical protein